MNKFLNSNKHLNINYKIEKYEEAVSQFKVGFEKAQQQYRETHAELVQSQQQLKDLKIIVTTSESNHRETLGIVADKSKENAYLKNEIHNLKQANDQILDQISQYDEKYRSAKNEFKKVQEETLKNQNQVIFCNLEACKKYLDIFLGLTLHI